MPRHVFFTNLNSATQVNQTLGGVFCEMYKHLDINENVKINESSSVFYILYNFIYYVMPFKWNQYKKEQDGKKITYLHV